MSKMPKFAIPLITAASVVVVGGAATAAVLLLNNGDAPEDGKPAITIGYQQDVIIADGVDDLQNIFEGLVAEEGMVDLSYKNVALSYDGINFGCSIGNPASNRYDMYFNIYFDYDLEQQMLLTGLLPPGTMIESFESEIKIDPGEYESVLVFTQVADDHATIVGQASVVLNLIVTDGEEIVVGVDEEGLVTKPKE